MQVAGHDLPRIGILAVDPRQPAFTWPIPLLYEARMMLIRSFAGVPSGKRSVFIIFDISLLANHMLVSGLETCSVGTSNWRATEGMICISPQAPRLDVMSGVKRDSW